MGAKYQVFYSNDLNDLPYCYNCDSFDEVIEKAKEKYQDGYKWINIVINEFGGDE